MTSAAAVDREVGGQRDDLGARGHHLFGGLLAELEDPLEQAGVLVAHRAALLALLDQHPDLLRRVQALVVTAGRTLTSRRRPLAVPFRREMGPAISQPNPIRGPATQRLMSSG